LKGIGFKSVERCILRADADYLIKIRARPYPLKSVALYAEIRQDC